MALLRLFFGRRGRRRTSHTLKVAGEDGFCLQAAARCWYSELLSVLDHVVAPLQGHDGLESDGLAFGVVAGLGHAFEPNFVVEYELTDLLYYFPIWMWVWHGYMIVPCGWLARYAYGENGYHSPVKCRTIIQTTTPELCASCAWCAFDVADYYIACIVCISPNGLWGYDIPQSAFAGQAIRLHNLGNPSLP